MTESAATSPLTSRVREIYSDRVLTTLRRRGPGACRRYRYLPRRQQITATSLRRLSAVPEYYYHSSEAEADSTTQNVPQSGHRVPRSSPDRLV